MAKKKKYIILARNKKTATNGLTTGKGHRSFGRYSALWISDEAEAREIEHQYGMKGTKDVSVTIDQQYEWSVNNEGSDGTKMSGNTHHYTFQGVDTSRIRTTRDNGYVWVQQGGRQVRMKREQALEEGHAIVPDRKKANDHRQRISAN